MKSIFRVTSVEEEKVMDAYGPALTVVNIGLEREVERTVAVHSPKEQMEEVVAQSTERMKGKVSEDTLRVTREIAMATMLPLASVGHQELPPPTIRATIQLTEEEYGSLGLPTIGMRLELDLSNMSMGHGVAVRRKGVY